MRVKMSKQPQPEPSASAVGPLPYCNPNCKTLRHWKFTQHHRTTRPPHGFIAMEKNDFDNNVYREYAVFYKR